jgi:glycosyltransferase involved in cell wall biosynthesis
VWPILDLRSPAEQRRPWRSLPELTPLAYDRLRSSIRRGEGAHRERLALVTPWPPQRSGIADYSRRLAGALGRRLDVDVVVDGAVADFDAPPAGVRLLSAQAYRAASWLRRHDHVLYCMGNSSHHEHVYELLREFPGPVVLHDAQLTGFFGYYAGRERPEDPLGRLVERVEECYGALVPAQERTTAPLDARRRLELGIFMTSEVLRHAEHVFVHSRFARKVVEREGRDLERRVGVSVMPFGMPDPEPDAVRSAAAQPPLIIHVGVLTDSKDLEVLIEAFALISARAPGARLVIAGPADEAGLEHWRVLARERAPHANIEVPGYLTPGRWWELLRQADAAVQLRAVSNGEASGAVCDCLAAGVPTIVSYIGWMSELPHDAVVHVPAEAGPALVAERVESVLVDTARRAALSRAALDHARACSFERVAADYLGALALS